MKQMSLGLIVVALGCQPAARPTRPTPGAMRLSPGECRSLSPSQVPDIVECTEPSGGCSVCVEANESFTLRDKIFSGVSLQVTLNSGVGIAKIEGLLLDQRDVQADVEALHVIVAGRVTSLEIVDSVIVNVGSREDSHGILVETVASAALGVAAIRENLLANLKTGTSEALAVKGDIASVLISGNNVLNASNIGIDVIGFEGHCDPEGPAYSKSPRNVVVVDNLVTSDGSSCDDCAGIYIDGALGPSLVVQNTVSGFYAGISAESESEREVPLGPVFVGKNTLMSVRQHSVIAGGECYTDGLCGGKPCEVPACNIPWVARSTFEYIAVYQPDETVDTKQTCEKGEPLKQARYRTEYSGLPPSCSALRGQVAGELANGISGCLRDYESEAERTKWSASTAQDGE